MLQDMTIAVVVPAYNEARLIGTTLDSIPEYVDQIVVVDDGSSDGTFERVAGRGEGRLRLVRHARNRGVGAAIAAGYRVAFEQGADVTVVMAGDGQMDPGDLERVLGPVLQGFAEYVKGDRLSHPQARRRMPLSRWMGNHLLSAMTRLVTGLPIRDSQCGYTALSRRAAERLPMDRIWSGYGYPNDLLGWLAQIHARVQEVVVAPIYGEEVSGVGLRHALFVIPGVLARVWLRRMAQKPLLRGQVVADVSKEVLSPLPLAGEGRVRVV